MDRHDHVGSVMRYTRQQRILIHAKALAMLKRMKQQPVKRTSRPMGLIYKTKNDALVIRK